MRLSPPSTLFPTLSFTALLLLSLSPPSLADEHDDDGFSVEIVGPESSGSSGAASGTRPATGAASRGSFVRPPGIPGRPPPSRECHSPAPGLDRVRRGLDITKLDFLPIGVGEDDGYRQPILDYTCTPSGGRYRRIRIRENGRDYYYQLPDQVTGISNVPGGVLQESVEIFHSSTEIRKAMAASASVELKGGMFSASASFSKMHSSLTNHSRYLETVQAFVSTYSADLAPYFARQLSRFAQQFVDQHLPPRFDQAPEKYAEFIQFYGTHFFSHAKLGGAISLTLETKKSYYLTNEEQKVKANAKATYLNIIKARGGVSGSVERVDEAFRSATLRTIRYLGGDINILSSSGLKSWQQSVRPQPWVLAGRLVPLSKLIKPSAKEQAMERAVQVHLDKARLVEKQAMVYSKLHDYPQVVELRRMLSDIGRLLSQPSPNWAEVDTVCNRVDRQLIPPAWFKEVQLCFRWYPDGDSGQCGGSAGLSRELCAHPEKFTQYYRDDTDRRGGGCRMSWGLKAPNSAPRWFRDTQICFRWYPDGNAGQCGGSGTPRLNCASVGRFTRAYRDDTDRRSGGCRMSWGLRARSSTPLWLRNLDLCYQWYPDGNAGQCGGGVDRNLCARTNKWTTYYRDDTDRRGGGCRMRWGIETN